MPDAAAASAVNSPRPSGRRWELTPRFIGYFGRQVCDVLHGIQGVGAFALITLGVALRKATVAGRVIGPLVARETARSGLQLLPMFLFVSVALGFLVIGQSVAWLTRVGTTDLLGSVMVLVVVRELGPLLTAFLVLARAGSANVVELGTARATGDVESLEALGIDPVHYLVVPRVLGMMAGVFALTIYLILGALLSGYGWAFIQDVPILPDAYFSQLARALSYLDFLLLAIKSGVFGFIIAITTCYHGLAQPLHLEQVPRATVRAVAQSVFGCVCVDALFLIVYLGA